MRRLLTLSACLVLAACSSSSGTKPGALDQPSSPTASSTVTSAPPATSGSEAPTSSATPQPGRHLSGGPVSSSPPSGAVSSSGPGQPTAVKGTAPGVYTYDTSGQVKYGATPQDASGTSTLTIGTLQNGHQHSTLHADQGDTDEDLVLRATGTYLADLNISAFQKEFRPSPPVLLFPTPARVGSTWSWSATSTDGKSHVSASNKVDRTETLTIGGQKVATVVLQTHLVITGDVSYTADVTTWVSTAYRLPVKDHTLAHGTLVVPFTADITDVMRSVRPA